MKTAGYVLLGIGVLLWVIAFVVYTSSPRNVVNYHGINGPDGLLIVGFVIGVVGMFMAASVGMREQAAKRAYEKQHELHSWRIPDLATQDAIRSNGYSGFEDIRTMGIREMERWSGESSEAQAQHLEARRQWRTNVPIPQGKHSTFTLPDGQVIMSDGYELRLVPDGTGGE